VISTAEEKERQGDYHKVKYLQYVSAFDGKSKLLELETLKSITKLKIFNSNFQEAT
jgi:hypothetical protein